MKKTILATVLAMVASFAMATGTASPAHAATTLTLMPMGDSITDGYQSTTGNGYRGPLWDELKSQGYSSLDFVGTSRAGNMSDPDNEGHNGWRIDQIAAIADSSLAKYKPDVVTLHLGTNDFGQNYQTATAADRLNSLVDQIIRDVPNATVLLATLIISTSPPVENPRAAYNTRIRQIVSAHQAAGKHVRLVDMGALTTADLYDSLHPNDGGYKKMADAFDRGVIDSANAGWIVKGDNSGGGTGTGSVRSGVAGKCLDLNGGNNANGTAAQIWSCNNTPAQSWTATGDTLQIMGKCLDASGAGTANLTKVLLWDCHSAANQVWQTYDGGYRNPASGRCLDDPAGSTTDGTQLVLFDCNGGSNQKWTTPGA